MRIAACSTATPSPPRWIADGAGRRVALRTPAGALFTRRTEGDPVSNDLLRPHDHAEAVALFRAEVIGALARRELSRGERAAEIRKLAKLRFRPPGRRATKVYGASTLQRWQYAYRHGGLAALRPDARSDRGRGRELTPEQRELLLDIRREHPGASVPLILRIPIARAGSRSDGDVVNPSTRVDQAHDDIYSEEADGEQDTAEEPTNGLAASAIPDVVQFISKATIAKAVPLCAWFTVTRAGVASEEEFADRRFFVVARSSGGRKEVCVAATERARRQSHRGGHQVHGLIENADVLQDRRVRHARVFPRYALET
jgi:hypothetical protein